MAELERAQKKAAELILEDEAWRDGLEDHAASSLLNAVLAEVDAAIAKAAEDGSLNEDLPYVLADRARAQLMERASSASGEASDPTRADPTSEPPSLPDVPVPVSDEPNAPPEFLPPDESLSDEPEVSPNEAVDPPP